MKERKEALLYSFVNLKNMGADKVQGVIQRKEKFEFNVFQGDISLLRTNEDITLDLRAIKDDRQASLKINNIDKNSIEEACKEIITLSKNGEKDEAFDIAPYQEKREFTYGDMEPNLDKMYSKFQEFLDIIKDRYPYLHLEESILEFNKSEALIMNTNGVELVEIRSVYDMSIFFTSKKNGKASSFNYSGISVKEIENELFNFNYFKRVLDQSEKETEAIPFEGKYTGKILVTPECMNDMLMYYVNCYLNDFPLISGTSIFKDKLGECIADKKLTVKSNMISDSLPGGNFITSDGFVAEDMTVIDKGVLKSFILTQYGANKTGKERSKNNGVAWTIEAGNSSFEEMVKSIDEGILLCRFSGGNPSSSGDFSGVAKNSFYIKDGEIKQAINEAMISGNLGEMFNSVVDVSKETVTDGNNDLPWILFDGVIVSGK
ncbi:TldD/PmbA family protein [Oceanirhabdus seepicola]|uniref:TldD/PmbA family protein n=1 Tax=Oceanirhabdus seepicola TaxID=2828781 RepID=A0A9J6NVY5_9CLOT|nr:metallopeptidase TldD-related protein [Oceanirhabdus seepicola]MCM1988166.1 TldD/PmbA family protein [Oceanirhabdus seepicola]